MSDQNFGFMSFSDHLFKNIALRVSKIDDLFAKRLFDTVLIARSYVFHHFVKNVLSIISIGSIKVVELWSYVGRENYFDHQQVVISQLKILIHVLHNCCRLGFLYWWDLFGRGLFSYLFYHVERNFKFLDCGDLIIIYSSDPLFLTL